MILIRSAQIVDGTGAPPFQADVLLNDDRIAAIGSFPQKRADLVVNGLGHHLTPGFIDINSNSDHQLTLFNHPDQKDFLLQGVTTVIGGMCGSSLAPLLYGSLESFQKWTDINKTSVNWQTTEELFQFLSRRRLGVNFGTLVGHSTIRRALIGGVNRDLTDKELTVFKELLAAALTAGALGLSFGLGYLHSRDTPYHEIKELAETVKNGLLAIHLRDDGRGVASAAREVLALNREIKISALVSHFQPILGEEDNYERGLELLSGAQNIHFDIYPFAVRLLPIYLLLPRWAQRGDLRQMYLDILEPHFQKQVLAELPKFKKGDLRIMEVPGAPHINQAEIEGGGRGLLKAMLMSQLRALVACRDINEKLLAAAIDHPLALIASNDGSPPKIRANTFLRYLTMTRLPLPAAIRKITALPAEKLGLKNRGLVKENYTADLTLFDDNKKIQAVFVSGQPAVLRGDYQNIYAGQIIKRG